MAAGRARRSSTARHDLKHALMTRSGGPNPRNTRPAHGNKPSSGGFARGSGSNKSATATTRFFRPSSSTSSRPSSQPRPFPASSACRSRTSQAGNGRRPASRAQSPSRSLAEIASGRSNPRRKKGSRPVTASIGGLRRPTNEGSPAGSVVEPASGHLVRRKCRSFLSKRTLGQTKFKLFTAAKYDTAHRPIRPQPFSPGNARNDPLHLGVG